MIKCLTFPFFIVISALAAEARGSERSRPGLVNVSVVQHDPPPVRAGGEEGGGAGEEGGGAVAELLLQPPLLPSSALPHCRHHRGVIDLQGGDEVVFVDSTAPVLAGFLRITDLTTLLLPGADYCFLICFATAPIYFYCYFV